MKSQDDRGNNEGTIYIKALLADHESILIDLIGNIKNYATVLKEARTSECIVGLMEKHETMAWMLKAHLS